MLSHTLLHVIFRHSSSPVSPSSYTKYLNLDSRLDYLSYFISLAFDVSICWALPPASVNLTNTFSSSRLIQVYSLRNYWLSKKLLISVSIVMAKHTEDIFKEGRKKKEGASTESTFYRILEAGYR